MCILCSLFMRFCVGTKEYNFSITGILHLSIIYLSFPMKKMTCALLSFWTSNTSKQMTHSRNSKNRNVLTYYLFQLTIILVLSPFRKSCSFFSWPLLLSSSHTLWYLCLCSLSLFYMST